MPQTIVASINLNNNITLMIGFAWMTRIVQANQAVFDFNNTIN